MFLARIILTSPYTVEPVLDVVSYAFNLLALNITVVKLDKFYEAIRDELFKNGVRFGIPFLVVLLEATFDFIGDFFEFFLLLWWARVRACVRAMAISLESCPAVSACGAFADCKSRRKPS